ncbi:uncharacterized protein LOC129302058 isoform X1 [Prosopis cineraria]|uniref:uncharacterized protein LOC129302058 isoform X1 n=1 Tax=Prosopis cineraria TaxID=364024 RepID=UPI0024103F38|nr:uncharacterized protein LOC129302058 isoform X1 [Prosopis cineraria]
MKSIWQSHVQRLCFLRQPYRFFCPFIYIISGSYASYLLPAATLVAVGLCCYIWWNWKRWSFFDLMSVIKQKEDVLEKIASTRGHLIGKLEVLGLKVEEQNELNQTNANDSVSRARSFTNCKINVELYMKGESHQCQLQRIHVKAINAVQRIHVKAINASCNNCGSCKTLIIAIVELFIEIHLT